MVKIPRGNRNLKRCTESYIDRQKIHSKPRSVYKAIGTSKTFLRILGNLSVYDLTESDLDSYILTRRSEGIRDQTINGDLRILKAILNHAVSVGLLSELPFKIRFLKVARKRHRKVFSREELQRILDCAARAVDPRFYGIILIAIHTGFRNDEILHLRWSDIDRNEGTIRITSKLDVGWSSKSHQERTVFVSMRVFDWLDQWRKDSTLTEDHDWIFTTRTRRPMTVNNVSRGVREIFQAANLYEPQNAVLHLIRHTVATRLISNGVDLETTRDILGHADVSTTAGYLHTSDQRKKAAAMKLEI